MMTLAYRAAGLGEQFRRIPTMVMIFHEYYTNTRYPAYRQGVGQDSIPADMYSRDEAERALSNAREILSIIEEGLN